MVLGRHGGTVPPTYCHQLRQLRLCGAQVQCYTNLERMDAEAHSLPRGLDPPLDLVADSPRALVTGHMSVSSGLMASRVANCCGASRFSYVEVAYGYISVSSYWV